MNIQNFVSAFTNYPVMFIGTGLSLRYLESSYTWDGLLFKIATDLEDEKFYFNLKSKHESNGMFQFEKIATDLESIFNEKVTYLDSDVFKNINNVFYENMKKGINVSRFKIYISNILNDEQLRQDKITEIDEFKKACKNINSIITTNYDTFIEKNLGFEKLVGNDIILSNPYGSVYKIHGCVTEPQKIIITDDDYAQFEKKYELIRAQLLSIFIHNPVIFIGYNIGDRNIKCILKTIFTYVDSNSELANKIKNNFLLVEYEKNSTSTEILEHSIEIDERTTIKINKLRTDNFISLYDSLSKINIPISVMDIRKVQNIVKDIQSGGDIKVQIEENVDGMSNNEKVLFIGSKNSIRYIFQTTKDILKNYFHIIKDKNEQFIEIINKQNIKKSSYFPIFAFSIVFKEIKKSQQLKKQQEDKLNEYVTRIIDNYKCCKGNHDSISDIMNDESISYSYKIQEIVYSILNKRISSEDAKSYLLNFKDKDSTDYNIILCAYDYVFFNESPQKMPIINESPQKMPIILV